MTQDFSSEPNEPGKGIEKLTNGGGTALSDAVPFASEAGSLSRERAGGARLVILSDGEDHSSHGSLKQAVQAAEGTGVTGYTISTKEERRAISRMLTGY